MTERKTFNLAEVRLRKVRFGDMVSEGVATSYEPQNLDRPENVARFVGPLIGGLAQEHFVVCALNVRHQLLAYWVATVGGAHSCQIDMAAIFGPAVSLQAASIVAAHNHPSGDVTPSMEDIAVTKRLVSAGKILGIPVVDHVVIGGKNHASLRGIRAELFQ